MTLQEYLTSLRHKTVAVIGAGPAGLSVADLRPRRARDRT